MPRDLVYFDLETQRTANDVGGWDKKHLMQMSIGVTYSTKQGKYIIYGEDDANALITQLQEADLVIGYNHISFDYEVLEGYTILDLKERLISFDLMVDLESKIGFKPKLEAVASATLGVGKTADGLEAIRWWKQGKILEIAEYCSYDVKVTKEVHEYGARNGFVKYEDKFKNIQEVAVDWTLD